MSQLESTFSVSCREGCGRNVVIDGMCRRHFALAIVARDELGRVQRRCTACEGHFWLPKASYLRTRCWECLPATSNGTRVAAACDECGKSFKMLPGRHRERIQRGLKFYCGDPCRGRVKPYMNGGAGHRNLTADGYVMVYVPPGERAPGRENNPTEREHRVVLARLLGRHLEPHETVHHINGDRADNRLENLQLRSGRHGKGYAATCRCCGSSDIEYVEI